jgi:hypothetical protein
MVSVSPFTTNVDIINRALQRLGATRISTLADVAKNATEAAFCYDKLRVAELRRSPWRFASRRANLRVLTATSYRFIPGVYSAATTYVAGNIVKDATGVYWISLAGSNIANTPGGAVTAGYPAYWEQYFGPVHADLWASDATKTYDAGDVVYKTGRTYYICMVNATAGTVDPASGAPWVDIGAETADRIVTFNSPAGPGKRVPATGGRLRNMFALPNGYLRMLPEDPKVESTGQDGTTAGIRQTDYQFEGNFIISNEAGPILLRYVADVSNVLEMDSLFCEGLAARIAFELCEMLTQNKDKMAATSAAYAAFMSDARLVNWIETANEEPQEEALEARTTGTAAPQQGR